MDLIVASALTLAGTMVGALVLRRIFGVPSRAEGTMARVLDGIPVTADRERWREELRRSLLEFEGRPLKQFREARELIRAAEGLVDIYAASSTEDDSPLGQKPADAAQARVSSLDEARLSATLRRLDRRLIVEVLEILSYRERRILELRLGLGEEGQLSAEKVAKKFNVFPARIEQIESQALKKLLLLVEAQKLREVR